eukprot:scaffold127839_cov33-Tisochrysis_lutea.AAC.1
MRERENEREKRLNAANRGGASRAASTCLPPMGCCESCLGGDSSYSDPEMDAAARRAAAAAAERRANQYANSAAGRAAARTQEQIARERRQQMQGDTKPALTASDWN